jgi:hypothetical protein
VNDQVGVLVEKGSIEALQNGILKLLCEKDKFDKERIRNYAKERFDNKYICQKYVSTYQRVLRK